MHVDKNQIKLFKENVCEQHSVFTLIKSVDFIHDTVCHQMQLNGISFYDEPSQGAYMNQDKAQSQEQI